MRITAIAAVVLAFLTGFAACLPIVFAAPPLEDHVVFPAGTFVIPMDEKQAERVLVFGFVHALLRPPNAIQVFRVIEPPDASLSTNMTASSRPFQGGPILVSSGDASKVFEVKTRPEFERVTVGTLTAETVLDNVLRVVEPTKVLIVKGLWGRTDITLDAMRIPYNTTTREAVAADPSMIFSYSLIVVDCPAWSGDIPTEVASNIRSHVHAGNGVIFTDIAMKGLDATFPGYVTLWGPQPRDRVANAYVYNPPRKFDPGKYGESADRFPADFLSQYYNPPPRANEIKVFTEPEGYVVSSIPGGKVDDVRILVDSKSFGPAGNQYAILSFYFQYGDGLVEGMASHPQQQTKSLVGNNGYYAVFQRYGNRLIYSPIAKTYSLSASPPSASTPQRSSVDFTITVTSLGAFNSPVTLSLAGLPPGATHTFKPSAPKPPAGGNASSILTVTVPLTTPIGSYVMNVTGRDPSTPPIVKWVLVTVDVTIALPDFEISVSPDSLTIDTTESKTAIVTVTSIGMFNQNVTLNVTGLPADVAVEFNPLSPRPPPGGVASSTMSIHVGWDAPNGTYPLTIMGSNTTLAKSAPFTLIIVRKPAPPLPLLGLLVVIVLVLISVSGGLLALRFSSRRRRAPPAPPPGPRPSQERPVRSVPPRFRCPRCGCQIPAGRVQCPLCGYTGAHRPPSTRTIPSTVAKTSSPSGIPQPRKRRWR
ncbi:hypothetical protein [[Eubacterium] cellulosolvens]